jgi:uncharacterized protein YktA (UPF0223 family)
MTREDFSKRAEKRIDLVRQTLLTKHKEYAKDDNVFRNFDEAAGGLSLHSTSAEVLWSYMTKHLVSIKDIVSDNVPVDNEVVSEKIGDVINYLILLEAMLNEKCERHCKLKEAYAKHKQYNKSIDRLSMWTSDYTKNTDMLGLVKMAANGSDHDIDKLKYNTNGDKGY